MNSIKNKLSNIRDWMKKNKYNVFIIPHEDEYMSEYLPPQNERLEWITGFNGSAGIAIITETNAAIFVDGRYTVQVQTQVSKKLFEIKHLILDPYLNWIKSNTKKNTKIAYDSKLHTRNWLINAKKILNQGYTFHSLEKTPIDLNWDNRPIPNKEKAILLDEKYTGKSSINKRKEIGNLLIKNNLDGVLITALDSICWLLNIRGKDVPCNPVLLSHALIYTNGNTDFFIDNYKIPEKFTKHVGDGVKLFSPSNLKSKLSELNDKKIGCDMNKGNEWLLNCIESSNADVVHFIDPCILSKSCNIEFNIVTELTFWFSSSSLSNLLISELNTLLILFFII